MLETLGLTAAEEIGLGVAVGVSDILVPELMIAEALAIAGVFIYRAIKKHREQKERQPEQPSNQDQDEPEAPDNLDDDIIEENERIDEEIDIENEQQDLNEERKEITEIVQRERRLDALRQEIGVEQTPDELLLYPPGVREEMLELERREQRLEEERKRQTPNPDGGGGGAHGGGNGGGGGPDGGDGGGDEPDWDEIANPYNDNPNRAVNPRENPFKKILKDSATRIAGQYASQLLKEKDDEKQHDEKKISDADYEQLKAENEQIKNQLETQKQLLDVLDAIGMNEITDEESLVQLEKIEQDIQQIAQKQVKVGDIFAQDAVTF